MRISNITMVGLRAIARNKMRSFLTALASSSASAA